MAYSESLNRGYALNEKSVPYTELTHIAKGNAHEPAVRNVGPVPSPTDKSGKVPAPISQLLWRLNGI